MGIKTFVPRFSPIRRFSMGLGTVLTPGKACLGALRQSLAMTPNGCHSQLCARKILSPRQPPSCGLAGRCAGVIEVARALCCL